MYARKKILKVVFKLRHWCVLFQVRDANDSKDDDAESGDDEKESGDKSRDASRDDSKPKDSKETEEQESGEVKNSDLKLNASGQPNEDSKGQR